MPSFQTKTSRELKGKIAVAADKSISHRSLIFSAIAKGESRIQNLLLGEDVLRTLTIINQLGVKTSHTAQNIKDGDELIVFGVGLDGLKESKQVLYCGNSGTTMRLMLGLLCGQNFKSVLTGDDSLNKRPMERVMAPLKKMGAEFSVTEKNAQRFIETGFSAHNKLPLTGIDFVSPVASAQVKTALILAGLNAQGVTKITEPSLSRNHSELMLKSMGAALHTDGVVLTVKKNNGLKPIDLKIPGDISSASFFIVAALIVKDSDLTIQNVNLNPTRTGIIDVLKKMGGDISILNQKEESGELVGDLHIKYSNLKNIEIKGDIIPRLIDEIPILALAGVFAEGDMRISDAKELRVKETDRIMAICHELKKMNVDIFDQPDGFVLKGLGQDADKKISSDSISFKSYGDHRMAMMEVIAGLRLPAPATIDDVSSVQTSFPQFFQTINKIK